MVVSPRRSREPADRHAAEQKRSNSQERKSAGLQENGKEKGRNGVWVKGSREGRSELRLQETRTAVLLHHFRLFSP